uniref:Uncharacterized protein LOC111126346 isoform X1 n=2 Tax=Crassostrea virginica TaxID=6565 RepID=A0A8B8DGB3_CRAVI|nr:uncharacterized protein LOC111126346 isoform X1 [Crassostrea virginica]
MDKNMQTILLLISMYLEVMKNIEEMKSKIENLSNKLTGNVTTLQDKIVQTQPLSALKKTTGTHPSKTTQFQLDERSETEEGISEMEDIHCECIQENLESLSEDINLQQSYLLDELIQNECLTENEATEIRKYPKRKDQNRKLAITIGKRSRVKFSSFVEVMKRTENYPHVAEKLESSYKAKTEEFRERQECVHCYIIRNVNMSDIIETLCSQKVVNLSFLDKVISCSEHDTGQWKKLWSKLIYLLNHSDDDKFREVFKESLRKKYEHISNKIVAKKHIKCRCRKIEPERMSWPSGSYTTEERSTTSTPALTKSHVSSKSAVSSLSERGSEVSDEESYSYSPRTTQWVKSISINATSITGFFGESEENCSEHDFPKMSKVDQTSDVEPRKEIKKVEKSTRTLAEIGDDFLQKTVITESCKEHNDTMEEKSTGNLEVGQTGQRVGKSKSARKKKKKRKKTRTTENPTKPEDSRHESLGQEDEKQTQSVNLTESQRTIGDRLFSNIPTIDCTNQCSNGPCVNSPGEQSALSSPTIVTPSRHVEPLEKVGCCNKHGNVKSKAKKKHKH